MVFCPKCVGLIGEEFDTCPLCNYQLTEEDKVNIKRKKEAEEVRRCKEEQKFAEKRAKNRILFFILSMSFIFGSLAVAGIVTKITHNIAYFGIIAIVGMVLEAATIIAGIVSGAYRCPYCDAILFRNYGSHCASCGKKLY